MNYLKQSFLAVLALITITACSSDDDGGSNELRFGTGTGQVTVNGSDFSFDKGIILNYGENIGEGTFNFDIELYSGDLSLTQLGPIGIGNYLFLELNSTQSSGLRNGTYTFNFDADDLSLTDGDLEINYDFQADASDQFFDVTGGTVEVSKNGNTYTLDFNLEVDGSEALTGSYVGTLGAIDATNL